MRLNFYDYTGLLYLILAYIKIIEMYYHKWLFRKGVKNSYHKLPISPKIARLPMIYWLFFKLPVIIIVLAILGYLTPNGIISWSIATTLLIILWALIGRMMYDLLYQGTNRYLSSISAPTLAILPQPSLSKQQQLRSFTFTLFTIVILVIVSYSTIFFICDNQLGKKAFVGIPDDGFEVVYFLYFSLVTFATVGYGDILPANDPNNSLITILPRLLVCSEICMSFTIVAVFVASFSLSFGNENNKTD